MTETISYLEKPLEISVSDVLTFTKCKRAFAYKLDGKKVNFRFGKSTYTGIKTHKILSEFARYFEANLFERSLEKKSFNEIYYYLKGLFFNSVKKELETDRLSSYDEIMEFLDNFSGYIASIIEKTKNTQIFTFPEKPIKFELFKNLYIKGRIDVLINDGEKLRLIDYKTKSENVNDDTIQLSLYYKGLKEAYNRKVIPTVLYFEKNWINSEELDEDLINNVLNLITSELKKFFKKYKTQNYEFEVESFEYCKFCSLKNTPKCKLLRNSSI